MTKILAIAGRRGSGKSSLTSFLVRNARELCGMGDYLCERYEKELGHEAIFKRYGFSAAMKGYLEESLGLDGKILNGSNADKEQLTHLFWEHWPTGGERTGPMTYREVMEEWMRMLLRFDPLAGVRPCLSRIRCEGRRLAIIDDLRRSAEVDAIRAEGGKVIRLHRFVDDGKKTWTDLEFERIQDVDYDLHNDKQTLEETQQELLHVLAGWDFLRLPTV